MTITGSDASFRSGGPQPPLPEESSKSAAHTMPAKSMMITQDSLNDPQVMRQMLSTKDADKGNDQSQAGKPVLPMMAQMRMDPLADAKTDEGWTNKYDQLFDKLPPDAKTRLQEEMKRPLESRNPLYAGLNKLLATAAKAMAWAEGVGKPAEPGTPEFERFEQLAKLPYLGMLGASTMNEEMMDELRDLLDDLGHNFENYDPLNDALNDLMEMLKNFSEIATRAVTGSASAEDVERLNNLTSTMEEKIKVLQGKNQGGASTLFLPYLQATRLVARAFSIPLAVAPQLILSLGIVQIGTDKEAGVSLGGGLGAVIDKGIVENLGGHQYVISSLVKTLLPALGVVSTMLSKHGLGPSQLKGEKELQASRFFELQITTHLVMKTGMFDTLATAIAETVNIPEKKRSRFKALMLFAIISAIALTGGKDVEKQSNMLSTLEKYFTPQLQELLQDNDEEGVVGMDDQAIALRALLKQSGAALEQGNFEDIVAMGWSGMGLITGNKENVEKELKAFRSNALNMAEAIEGGINENKKRNPEVAIVV